MKRLALILSVFAVHSVLAQCVIYPSMIKLGGNCLGTSYNINYNGALSQIVWYKDGVPVSTVTAHPTNTGTTVAGGNGAGAGANQFIIPNSVVVDPDGNLYIADVNNHRIQKWAPGATSGITVAGGNGVGLGANQLYAPYGLFRDLLGNIYIADTENHRVQKWAPGATSGVTVAGGNGQGSAANQLDEPYAVCVDAAGNVYVADYNNARIQKWAPGAASGVTVAGGNGQGSAANQLFRPMDVKVDGTGNIYIADFANDRVQLWAPGATSGVTIAGGPGSGPDQVAAPTGIALDGSGTLYICDGGNSRVQKWAPGATSGVTVAGGNGYGSAATQFGYASGVAVDNFGNVYVVDAVNNRIQEWPQQANVINTYYTPAEAGSYYAVVTDANGCTGTTNTEVIKPTLAPGISISPTNVAVDACGIAEFVAAPVNGGTYPTYQWQVNGVNAGVNSAYFFDGNPTAGDVITCTISTSYECGIPVTAHSNSSTISITPVSPAKLIPGGDLCSGSLLKATPADRLQKIQWYKDGAEVATSSSAANTGVEVAGTFTQNGSTNNTLYEPVDVAVDAAGNVFVADFWNYRVMKWAPGAITGSVAAGGNGPGNLPDRIDMPSGVCLDAAGNLYIADGANNRIQKWASGATIGVTVAGGNGAGPAANQLDRPNHVRLDAAGNLYVADWGNNRIQKWAPGATSGVTVAGGNGGGSAPNQLQGPVGVFVDAAGNIYVADAGNNRIQKWPSGATSGVTVAGGNGAGPAANQLYNPMDVLVDNDTVYIADATNNRIQKWAPGATTGVTVAGTGVMGTATNQFEGPVAIYRDVHKNIYVADENNYRVMKWPPPQQPDSTFTATSAGTYKAVLTTASGCTMTTNDLVIGPGTTIPQVTISTPNTFVDACTPVVFTATPVNGGAAPVYQWKVNGTAVNENSTVFTSRSLHDGDIVTCTMTSNAVCIATPTATSNTISLTVYPLPPSILTTKGTHCAGDSLYVSTDAPLSQITWMRNNTVLGKTSAVTVPSFSSITVAGGNGRGSGADQLFNPYSIFVDSSGNVYVADLNNHRIQKWAPGATSGVTVAGDGISMGLGNDTEVGFFVDAAGNIYYSIGNEIIKWAPGAASGVVIAGGIGSEFSDITGLFVDKAGNIYVSDWGYGWVAKLAPGASRAVAVAGPYDPVTGATVFNTPAGIFVDDSANVYIVDAGNNCVQKWPPGATKGIIVAGGNGYGSAANQLANPTSVYVDGNGNVFVADRGNSRIQEWKPGATEGITVAGGNGPGPGANQLAGPTGVFLDAQGYIYIDDYANNRVQKWGLKPVIDTTWQATEPGDYTAIVTTAGGCTIQSNDISFAAAVTPSINISAASTTVCAGTPITFTAVTGNMGDHPVYQWKVNGVDAGDNSPTFKDAQPTDGDKITCTLTSDAACATPPTAVSNQLSVTVKQVTPPSISIRPSVTTACSGVPVTFTATLSSGGVHPVYHWQVNGIDRGANDPVLTSNDLHDGDVVSCIVTNDANCAPATSNSVVMTIYPNPVIAPGQIYSVSAGQTIQLTPSITGDIQTYTWLPPTGLSDASIRDPMATPLKTIEYTLQVVSADGCPATGKIIVKVFTDIAIPGAFSPNGDGHNDIFYVLGGPQGSVIKSFTIFNRWGELVFKMHDVVPGDASFGWNGRYKGQDAPTGGYVYAITVAFAGGEQQVFRGTLLLVR